MRQVLLQVPDGAGEQLASKVGDLGATTLSRLRATDGTGGPVELLVVTVPNANVATLLERASAFGPIEASIPAVGALTFQPPVAEPSDELIDVTATSPYEVVLAGRQSTGGWRGFVTYAVMAGAVAWLGLSTETIYLLTGSMLIAPFAGPAMNTAIGIAAGRPNLLRHSLLRYAVGISLTVAAAALLTLVAGQDVVTGLLASVMTVSLWAVLLPLVAGAAGATFLVQAEHSSLISGAAVGILVAASLAPPAAGTGIALALGRFDLVAHGAFLVALQLSGITAAAVVVFWSYGLRPTGHLLGSDHPRMLRVGLGLAVVFTVGLVALQQVSTPFLTQGSAANDVAETVAAALDEESDIALLDVDARVASSKPAGSPRVLVEVLVERQRGTQPAGDLQQELEEDLLAQLRDAVPGVTPHVVVTVFGPPQD